MGFLHVENRENDDRLAHPQQQDHNGSGNGTSGFCYSGYYSMEAPHWIPAVSTTIQIFYEERESLG